jgi:hypothetical protein
MFYIYLQTFDKMGCKVFRLELSTPPLSSRPDRDSTQQPVNMWAQPAPGRPHLQSWCHATRAGDGDGASQQGPPIARAAELPCYHRSKNANMQWRARLSVPSYARARSSSMGISTRAVLSSSKKKTLCRKKDFPSHQIYDVCMKY